MTPRLVSSVLAAALLVGSCSSSDETATTSTSSSTVTTGPADTTPTTAVDSVPTTVADSATTPTTAPSTTSTETTDAPGTTDAPSTTDAAGGTTTTVDPGGFSDSEQMDRDAARTALVTLSVFPDGWVEDAVEDDDDEDSGTSEFEAQFDACLGRDGDDQVGDELDRLKVTTDDFHPAEDDSTTVTHEVVLAPDVATALEAMAEVRIDGAEPCLADVIGGFYRSTFAEDPELADVGIGDVVVTRTETERDPDVMVGVLLEVPLTIDDQTVSQFLELLYQRQGRALSELSFSSFGDQFSRDGYTVLSDEAIIRLASIGN